MIVKKNHGEPSILLRLRPPNDAKRKLINQQHTAMMNILNNINNTLKTVKHLV